MTKRGNATNAYGTKCDYQGIEFASLFERDVYLQLLADDNLTQVYCQVPFEINGLCDVSLSRSGGKAKRVSLGKRKYVMDFLVLTTAGEWWAIEAKGYPTALWKMKRDVFIASYIAGTETKRFNGQTIAISQYTIIYQGKAREDYRPLTRRLL